MVISIYNNLENDVLTITTAYTGEISTKSVDNITTLYNNDNQIVGINVFASGITTNGYLSYDELPENYRSLFAVETKPAFVYGQILECVKHEKSDKLKVCKVDLGDDIVQIVCGAANCEENKIAVVARVGAVMPSGLKIVPSSLINVESNGMLCSVKELIVPETESTGIKLFEVGEKVVGQPVKREDLV